MKKIICIFFTILAVLPLNIKAYDSSATSAILMDIDSKRIIYAKNIHTKRSIASISKIMTAILTIESGKLDDIVTIGAEIEDAYGSGIYIKQQENIKLEDLLYGLMLRSGNDAALAIAKYVGGSVGDFVTLMNDKAKELGMLNSEFNNPSGLDEEKGNYSTAYDMAILTSYAMHNEKYREIVGTKRHKVATNMNYYDWTNKNKLLLSYKYCTGGKTGFTEIAKRTLVTTASKDNLNLVSVTLNDGNDFADHKNLFEEAFNNYQNYILLKKGKISIPEENYYNNYELYINEDISYPFSADETNSIKIKYEIQKLKDYENNNKIGEAIVYVNNEEIAREPIYINVEKDNKRIKNGFFNKITDWIKSLW